MTDRSTLEQELKEAAGQAFGEGLSADEIVGALETVQDRFERLQEVDE